MSTTPANKVYFYLIEHIIKVYQEGGLELPSPIRMIWEKIKGKSK